MFDIRKVRENVVARAKLIRDIREEEIHDLYTRAIAEELREARVAAQAIAKILAGRVSHPGKGWIMVTREETAEAQSIIAAFVHSFGAL